MRRRDFVRWGVLLPGALLAGRRAAAIGDRSRFRFGQVKLPAGTWNVRPTALRRMAWEIEKRTSIDVHLDPAIVTLSDGELHETPFLYLAGDREFEVPDQRSIDRLRRFLTFGGFLLVDSAEGVTGGGFDRSVRRLLRATFPPPARGLELVPGDHVVFKSFYLIDRPLGRVAISPVMEGIVHDTRLVVGYVQNDLGGAWARDNFGNYIYPCVPGGDRQRELAFRFGVNVVMYALCLDYKSDQVHVDFIMRRRRWRPDGSTSTPIPSDP